MSDAYAAAGVDIDASDRAVGAIVGVLRVDRGPVAHRPAARPLRERPAGHRRARHRVRDRRRRLEARRRRADRPPRHRRHRLRRDERQRHHLRRRRADRARRLPRRRAARPRAARARSPRACAVGAQAAGVEIPGGELAVLPELIRGHPSPHGFDLCASVHRHRRARRDRHRRGRRARRRAHRPARRAACTPTATRSRAARCAALDYDDTAARARRRDASPTSLLEPTVIYVRAVLELLRSGDVDVHGLAHITGGGLDNLRRLRDDVEYAWRTRCRSRRSSASCSGSATSPTTRCGASSTWAGLRLRRAGRAAPTTAAQLLAAHHPGARRIGAVGASGRLRPSRAGRSRSRRRRRGRRCGGRPCPRSCPRWCGCCRRASTDSTMPMWREPQTMRSPGCGGSAGRERAAGALAPLLDGDRRAQALALLADRRAGLLGGPGDEVGAPRADAAAGGGLAVLGDARGVVGARRLLGLRRPRPARRPARARRRRRRRRGSPSARRRPPWPSGRPLVADASAASNCVAAGRRGGRPARGASIALDLARSRAMAAVDAHRPCDRPAPTRALKRRRAARGPPFMTFCRATSLLLEQREHLLRGLVGLGEHRLAGLREDRELGVVDHLLRHVHVADTRLGGDQVLLVGTGGLEAVLEAVRDRAEGRAERRDVVDRRVDLAQVARVRRRRQLRVADADAGGAGQRRSC